MRRRKLKIKQVMGEEKNKKWERKEGRKNKKEEIEKKRK